MCQEKNKPMPKHRFKKLPLFIIVGCILNTVFSEFLNHTVKLAFPHFLKPFGMTEPFYESGTDCIVCFDKGSAQGSFCEYIVTVTAECPDLGAIVRAIDRSCNVTAAGR